MAISKIGTNSLGNVTDVSSSTTLSLKTAGTTAVTVDASQNVGIGTSSPASLLDVAGTIRSTGSTPFVELISGSTTMGGLYSPDTTSVNLLARGSKSIIFMSGGTTERMRIDSSGYITTVSQPAFSLSGTGAGSKSSGTVIGFTDAAGTSAQVTYNISGSWSNANNRFTAPVAGIYLFIFGIYVQNANSAFQSIAPRVNGSQLATGDTFILFSGTTGSADSQIHATFTLKLSVGDYVDLAVRITGPTITYYPGHSFFQGYLLG